MKISVIGDTVHFNECREKLGDHEYVHFSSHEGVAAVLLSTEVVIDFLIHEEPAFIHTYAKTPRPVFLNTCKISLAALVHHVSGPLRCNLFGFNGLPTLFNREHLEVSVLDRTETPILQKICQHLKTEYRVVDDRVGLVTPRVICMIINEAYYSVQEGTATREDIDLAMKLGTNYPYGPFEWCEKIGVENVYELIQAVYDDTKDERYKVCPLLKKEYLGRA